MIGLKIGSFTTSISTSSTLNNKITYDLILLDNNTNRTIPSIYTFESTQQSYIGFTAKAHLKKNINFTIENISRLIAIEPETEFSNNELNEKYVKYCDFKQNDNKFIVKGVDFKALRLPSEIVSSFINIFKNEYLKNVENNQVIYVNIPDYLTYSQKKIYMSLLEENKLNAYLIPESVAMTLYYGYTKSQDLFYEKKKKNVILVDIGHSKSIFILAEFKEDIFKILDFKLFHIGGRDIDYLIYDYLVNNVVELREINENKIKKFKYKIYEEIKEIKKMLCVNLDYDLQIDKLDGEDKIGYKLSRAKFEEISKSILDQINKKFDDFLVKNHQRISSNNTIIECLSDLLKIPYLRDYMNKNNYNIKVYQTVQSDENISIGCSLFGSFINNNYPNKIFKNIYGFNYYTIYYQINGSENIFIEKGESLPNNKIIKVYDIKEGQKIKILFYYNLDDIKYYSKENKLFNVDFIPNKEMINANSKEIELNFIIEINGMIKFDKAIVKKEFKLENYKKPKHFIKFEEIKNTEVKSDKSNNYIPFKNKQSNMKYDDKMKDNIKENKNSKNDYLKKSTFYGTNLKLNQYYENDSNPIKIDGKLLESNEQNDFRKFNQELNLLKQHFDEFRSKVYNFCLSSNIIDNISNSDFIMSFTFDINNLNYNKNTTQDILELKNILNKRNSKLIEEETPGEKKRKIIEYKKKKQQ